jgi:hypothetical protein
VVARSYPPATWVPSARFPTREDSSRLCSTIQTPRHLPPKILAAGRWATVWAAVTPPVGATTRKSLIC